MTDTITNELMYEVLKNIHKTQGEHSKEFQNVGKRLESIDQHMAGFHITASHHQEEIQTLKKRVDRVEKRLDLND